MEFTDIFVYWSQYHSFFKNLNFIPWLCNKHIIKTTSLKTKTSPNVELRTQFIMVWSVQLQIIYEKTSDYSRKPPTKTPSLCLKNRRVKAFYQHTDQKLFWFLKVTWVSCSSVTPHLHQFWGNMLRHSGSLLLRQAFKAAR